VCFYVSGELHLHIPLCSEYDVSTISVVVVYFSFVSFCEFCQITYLIIQSDVICLFAWRITSYLLKLLITSKTKT
jgi:hypothetical protein